MTSPPDECELCGHIDPQMGVPQVERYSARTTWGGAEGVRHQWQTCVACAAAADSQIRAGLELVFGRGRIYGDPTND